MAEKDRFQDNGDGTITDHQMKVMWRKTDSFQDTNKWLNWFKGQDYVEISNLERVAGYEDWRFPTQEEAWSLFDLKARNTDKYGEGRSGHSIRGRAEGLALEIRQPEHGLPHGAFPQVIPQFRCW